MTATPSDFTLHCVVLITNTSYQHVFGEINNLKPQHLLLGWGGGRRPRHVCHKWMPWSSTSSAFVINERCNHRHRQNSSRISILPFWSVWSWSWPHQHNLALVARETSHCSSLLILDDTMENSRCSSWLKQADIYAPDFAMEAGHFCRLHACCISFRFYYHCRSDRELKLLAAGASFFAVSLLGKNIFLKVFFHE